MPRVLVVVPDWQVPRIRSTGDAQVVFEGQLVKCHCVADVIAAAGSSFVTISPVAPTLTKPGYGPALGVAGVRAAVEVAEGMPVYALGGVDVDNAHSFLEAGAYGVAVMGSVLRAEDPNRVVRLLVEALR
ncbi:MAG TPA: thiamine phosphate synthase [Nocardioidaceae bacterium]|nr:thiamine phosphate synthase [Nocardioidaceae bacterium]